MKTFKHLLIELNACKEAVKWAQDKTIKEVVEQCHRGDWLLWLAQKVDIGLQPLTLAKGHCANTVRHLMEDESSLKAVDTAIAYGEGKVSIEELNAATDAIAADAIAADAIASAAASAAYAAAYAAASAAADAIAYAAASAASKKENQMLTADICRKYIGDLIIDKVNKLIK
jgi:hypothetical protein